MLPKHGFVTCRLQREEDGQLVEFGYDLDSGAWYDARWGSANALLSTGEAFVTGDRLSAGAAPKSTRNLFIERRVMGFVWLSQICRQRECVVSSERTNNGGWKLVIRAPFGDPLHRQPGDPLLEFELTADADGRLLSFYRPDSNTTEEIRYIGQAQAGYPIGTSASGTWRIVEASVGPSRPITAEMVRRINLEHLKSDPNLRASADPGVVPGTIPAGGPVEPTGSAGMARPLVVTGAFVVVIGVILWWRRRP
jgi:hypothetical protein